MNEGGKNMSTSTTANLKGKVLATEILDFIKETFDPNATMHVKKRAMMRNHLKNL